MTHASCDTCHRTTSWIPAVFSHVASVSNFASCHDGRQASGKPAGHFVTAQDCATCHVGTEAWAPVHYNHLAATYPVHPAGVTCAACHTGNNQAVTWRYPAQQPTCAACHANARAATVRPGRR